MADGLKTRFKFKFKKFIYLAWIQRMPKQIIIKKVKAKVQDDMHLSMD